MRAPRSRLLAAVAGAIAAGSIAAAPAAATPSPSTSTRPTVERYVARGTPITGSDNPADGPALLPGQYADTLARGQQGTDPESGTTKYYSINLLSGETPYVAATIVAPAASNIRGDRFGIQVTIEQGDLCRVEDEESVSGTERYARAVTAVAIGTGSTVCLRAGPAVVEVNRMGPAFAGRSVQVELGYRAEPPVRTAGPEAIEQDSAPVSPKGYGSAQPIHSGPNYDDAPRLTSGVYSDSFVAGESRYVRVHLDWGQRLAVSITPTKLAALGPDGGVYATLEIETPLRADIFSSDTTGHAGADGETLAASTDAPVRYRNRDSQDSEVTALSIAGDYFVTLATAYPANARAYSNPYVLKISVVGRAEAGPTYRPFTGAGALATNRVAPSTSEGHRFPTATVVGAIVGVVVAVGVALLVFWRRRRQPRFQT